MELASRDVISRAEQTEIDEGRGVDGNVLLDLRHLGAERSSSACTARASSRWSSPGSTRSTSRSRCVRAPTTTWAASTPTSSARPTLEGLYAAGECRVRLRARREPPGRERAHGDDHLRQARRARGCRLGARRTRPSPSRSRPLADAERELGELLDRTEGERPHAIRDEMAHDDARELRRLPPRGADAPAGRDRRRPARALRARRRRGQGRRSSTTT